MSFSSQVKDELVKTEYEQICCKKSLLYGMALFAKKSTINIKKVYYICCNFLPIRYNKSKNLIFKTVYRKLIQI